MSESGRSFSSKQKRRDRMLIEENHDPYQNKLKLKENTLCSECAAVYKKGRWVWSEKGDVANQVLCPACQRIRDKVPAGFLTISSDYLSNRSDDLMNLIRNTEAREKQAHPLKRIMTIDNTTENMQLTFTDPGLARNIGDAVANAYGGELDYTYSPGEYMLRVTLTT